MHPGRRLGHGCAEGEGKARALMPGVRRVLSTVLQVVLLLLPVTGVPVPGGISAGATAHATAAATARAPSSSATSVRATPPPGTRPPSPDTGLGAAASLLTTVVLAALFAVLLVLGRRRDRAAQHRAE